MNSKYACAAVPGGDVGDELWAAAGCPISSTASAAVASITRMSLILTRRYGGV